MMDKTATHDRDDLSSEADGSIPLNEPDREWEDVEPDEESVRITSLFDDTVFPTVLDMLEHDKLTHGFDLAALLAQMSGM